VPMFASASSWRPASEDDHVPARARPRAAQPTVRS
jgi:hypothetical protein